MLTFYSFLKLLERLGVIRPVEIKIGNLRDKAEKALKEAQSQVAKVVVTAEKHEQATQAFVKHLADISIQEVERNKAVQEMAKTAQDIANLISGKEQSQ